MKRDTKQMLGAIIAATLIVGSGIGVMELSATDSQNKDEEIDWALFDLNVPELAVPVLEVPTLEVPKLTVELANSGGRIADEEDTVTVELGPGGVVSIMPSIGSNVTVQAQSLIDVSMILSSIKSYSLSDAELSALAEFLSMPTAEGFILDVKTMEVPGLVLAVLDELGLGTDSVSIETVKAVVLEQVALECPDDQLADWIKFTKAVKERFVDYRMAESDSAINFSNPNIQKWLKIYDDYTDAAPVSFVPVKNRFKMITEVGVPRRKSELRTLDANLDYYKSEGYDSVLVTFTYEDDQDAVVNIIKYIIRYHGMKVWLAYSGRESLYTTVLMDPEKYRGILAGAAPYISGYLNSWRRTSCHLWKQDAAFMNFTNITLRTVNPNLPIIGELYLGNTYKFEGLNNIGFETNVFENVSAVMFVNFGFSNINVKKVMEKTIRSMLKDYSKVACVIGGMPYYLTERKNGLTYAENMAIKHRVEDQFLMHGCIGVVTLSDDGREKDRNDLTKTLYSTLNGF